jgi:hypothetical protein
VYSSRPERRTEPADGGARKSWKWWYSVFIFVPALIALLSLVWNLAIRAESVIPPISGVRLGMTPSQVRQRFEGGSAASWRTELDGVDLRLIRGPTEEFDRESRFEFHNGMLVAIRLDLREDAPLAEGEPLVISVGSVMTRGQEEAGRVMLTVLARDCPTHAGEVSRILSERH